MGFYTPATIVKDAQRHGTRVLPVCARESNWLCTVVSDDTVRLGFCIVNGMRKEHGEALVAERERAPFASVDDFKRRVELSKEELRTIAELGALNCFDEHRRSAMWKVEETIHDDLLDARSNLDGLKPSRFSRTKSKLSKEATTSPLACMS